MNVLKVLFKRQLNYCCCFFSLEEEEKISLKKKKPLLVWPINLGSCKKLKHDTLINISVPQLGVFLIFWVRTPIRLPNEMQELSSKNSGQLHLGERLKILQYFKYSGLHYMLLFSCPLPWAE